MREYADVLTMRRLKKKRDEKRGYSLPKSKIQDNSEPWMENPQTLADFLWISDQVRQVVERCRKP